MSIKRITSKLSLDQTGTFIIVYGQVLAEEFIDEDLTLCDVDQIFWKYLKQQGFERIVYFDIARRLFCYDQRSFELCRPEGSNTSSEEATQEAAASPQETHKSGTNNRPLGRRSVFRRRQQARNQATPRPLSQQSPDGYYQLPITADTLAVQTLDALIKEKDIKTALIFNQFEKTALSRIAGNQLFNYLTHWVNLPSSLGNKCFLIFQSATEEQLYESTRDYPTMRNLVSNAQNNTGLHSMLYMSNPMKDELARLLQRVRLRNNLQVHWSGLDKMLRWIEAENKPLKHWAINFRKLKELSYEQVKYELIAHGKNVDERPGSERLEELIGLENVKEQVKKHIALIKATRKNPQLAKNRRLHLVLQGNPGTGKTTVARLIAEIYRDAGVLERGHLVETERKGLVAEYVGQTSPKTDRVCQEALDGVLFIDEVYNLKQHENDTFGQEAIDTLMKFMEDEKDRLCVIMAGYNKEISEFLESNPGLQRRVGVRVDFEDYRPEELKKIFDLKARQMGVKIADELQKTLTNIFVNIYERRDEKFGNASEAEKLLQGLIENHIIRCEMNGLDFTQEVIQIVDIPKAYEDMAELGQTEAKIDEALAELRGMIGLKSVKELVQSIVNRIRYNQKLIQKAIIDKGDQISLHLVFTGNPGTGKTTVARIIGKTFKALGVVKKGHVVEVQRADLVAGYVGQTAIKTREVIETALDGILFIDEAYTLTRSSGGGDTTDYGQEAVNTLLAMMENHRDRLVVIAAGYPEEMKQFIESNPGLQSRFTNYLQFEDYVVDDLWLIFQKIAQDKKYRVDLEAESKVKDYFEYLRATKQGRNFGNGREARNLYAQALSLHEQRILPKMDHLSHEEILTIKADDIPVPPEDFVKPSEVKPKKREKVKIPLPTLEPHDLKAPEGLLNCLGFIDVATHSGQDGSGSGFVISPEGHILTCHHVVENAKKVTFRFEDTEQTIEAKVIFSDKRSDLALIKIDPNDIEALKDETNEDETDQDKTKKKLPYLPLSTKDEAPVIGHEIGLLGYPLGVQLGTKASYSKGVISSFRKRDDINLLQTDVSATHGYSGGPVFRLDTGRIIGVLTGGIDIKIAAGINLVIDIREVYQFIAMEVAKP
ncbi:MAG TPA: AAA family ATPase [Microscillaceae bacterium]|nr:AAA family ATPase [Microscillaceae bacterium]